MPPCRGCRWRREHDDPAGPPRRPARSRAPRCSRASPWWTATPRPRRRRARARTRRAARRGGPRSRPPPGPGVAGGPSARFMGARWGVDHTVTPISCSISGVCRWSSSPYAAKFSSTAQKVVPGLGGRPAPETPLAASTITPAVSMAPATARGRTRASQPLGSSPGQRCPRHPHLGAVDLGQPVDEPVDELGVRVGLAGVSSRPASFSRKSTARSMTGPVRPSRSPASDYGPRRGATRGTRGRARRAGRGRRDSNRRSP